jgi:hypothetical protein
MANNLTGIQLMTWGYAEIPAPVASLLWAGTPPTPPTPITVSAGPMTSIVFTNISASTSPFRLVAGTYGMWVTATWSSGSVTLQILSADQLTWVTALTAFSANSFATVSLPNGIYRVNVTSATAVYASLQIVV